QFSRPLLARHLLCDRAFSLYRRTRHKLRVVCGDLLLVSESDWSSYERVLGEGAFLADADLHERNFSADVFAGHGRYASALVRRRAGLERFQCTHLGAERISMEHADLMGSLDHGPGANSIHHQFLLEH